MNTVLTYPGFHNGFPFVIPQATTSEGQTVNGYPDTGQMMAGGYYPMGIPIAQLAKWLWRVKTWQWTLSGGHGLDHGALTNYQFTTTPPNTALANEEQGLIIDSNVLDLYINDGYFRGVGDPGQSTGPQATANGCVSGLFNPVGDPNTFAGPDEWNGGGVVVTNGGLWYPSFYATVLSAPNSGLDDTNLCAIATNYIAPYAYSFLPGFTHSTASTTMDGVALTVLVVQGPDVLTVPVIGTIDPIEYFSYGGLFDTSTGDYIGP